MNQNTSAGHGKDLAICAHPMNSIPRLVALVALSLFVTSKYAYADQPLQDSLTTPVASDPNLSINDHGSPLENGWSLTNGTGGLTFQYAAGGSSQGGPTVDSPVFTSGNFNASVTVNASAADFQVGAFYFTDLTANQLVSISIGSDPGWLGHTWVNDQNPGGFLTVTQDTPVTLQYTGTVVGNDELLTTSAYYNSGSGNVILAGNSFDLGAVGSYEFGLGSGMYGSNSPSSSVTFSNLSVQSVPDGGTTIAMLSGALAGLAAFRRRFAK